jgi:hypothetical protein
MFGVQEANTWFMEWSWRHGLENYIIFARYVLGVVRVVYYDFRSGRLRLRS